MNAKVALMAIENRYGLKENILYFSKEINQIKLKGIQLIPITSKIYLPNIKLIR